jgi:diguanylate cyclase (GGDEF)-like protein
MPMDIRHFHTLYWVRPRQGRLDVRVLGKFFYDGTRVAKLEDHYGFLSELPHEGPATPAIKRQLKRLFQGGAHMRVVEKNDGPPPESKATPSPVETPAPVSLRPAPVFDYHRQGMDKPHTLEISSGQALLDGNLLSHEETQQVLSNVKNRVATLRYRTPADDGQGRLAKMEEVMAELAKAEGTVPSTSLADDLEAMRGLVAQGHLPQERYDRLRRELFVDDLTGLGNLRSYQEHLQRSPGGVHVLLDLDHLKAINDAYGHEHGDRAIAAAGKSIRAAIDHTVGDGVTKAHHLHGDEFHFTALNADHAHRIVRQLRHELEAVPPAGGTHRLSMSVGLGMSPVDADKALRAAKAQKAAAILEAGGDPTDRLAHVRSPHTLHVHSLIPGQEGAVPVVEAPPADALPSVGGSESTKKPVDGGQ